MNTAINTVTDPWRNSIRYIENSKTSDSTIVLLMGQHSSIERWKGLYEFLNEFGHYVSPEYPGTGKSIRNPDFNPNKENIVKWVTWFINNKCRSDNLIFLAGSAGFFYLTHAFHSELSLRTKTKGVIGISAFTGKECLNTDLFRLDPVFKLLSAKLGSKAFKKTIKSKAFYTIMKRMVIASDKLFSTYPKEIQEKIIETEYSLWLNEDPYTYFSMAYDFLHSKSPDTVVDIPIISARPLKDRYINPVSDEYIKKIYPKATFSTINYHRHAPHYTATAKEIAEFIPEDCKTFLKEMV